MTETSERQKTNNNPPADPAPAAGRQQSIDWELVTALAFSVAIVGGAIWLLLWITFAGLWPKVLAVVIALILWAAVSGRLSR